MATKFNDGREYNQISASSVQKLLFKRGPKSYSAPKKPFLSKAMKAKRIAWCKNHKDKDAEFWRNVVFSDETYLEINLSKAMNRVRRFSFQNPLDANFINETLKHPLKLMIWSCFSYKGVGRLAIIKGSMNSQRYIETLESKLR